MENSELPQDYRNDISAEFKSAHERRRNQTPSGEVFHYTSAESFRQIVETGEMWLSNTAYLNDKNELHYPTQVCRERLSEKARGIKITLADLDPASSPRAFLNSLEEEMSHQHPFKPWYTTSLSLESNRLSQWRAYCQQGGFAIGFDGAALAGLLRKRIPLMFGPVEYSTEALSTHVDASADRFLVWREELQNKYRSVPRETVFKDCLHQAVLSLSNDLLFFKMPAFAEEQEWRIVLHAAAIKRLGFRSKHSLLIPYVPVDLKNDRGILPLTSVWVGPLGEQELNRHSAILLLETNGYGNGRTLVKTAGYELRP